MCISHSHDKRTERSASHSSSGTEHVVPKETADHSTPSAGTDDVIAKVDDLAEVSNETPL